MTLRNHFGNARSVALGFALPLCMALTACSGSQGTPQAFADVVLAAYYDPNHNNQNACQSYQSQTEVFSIGTATGNCDPKTGVCNGGGPTRVKDGDTQSGSQVVNVQCSVKGGFDLNLQVSLGSMGALSISGHADANGGQNLNADINFEGSEYTSSACSVAYTYAGAPVPEHPPIAPGRVWGHLSCPQMGDPTGVRHKILMDMSLIPDACDGEVDFIFENCSM